MKSLLWKKSEKLTGLIAAISLCIYAIATALFGILTGKLITSISESNIADMKRYILLAITLLVVIFIAAYAGKCAVLSNSIMKICKLKNRLFFNGIGEPRGVAVDLADFTTKSNTVYNDYFVGRWNIFIQINLFVCAVIAIVYIDWIMLIVAVVSSLLPMGVPLLFGKKLEKRSVKYNDASNSYLDFVTDTLRGRLEIIKNDVVPIYDKKHMYENINFEETHFDNATLQNFAAYFGELVGGASFFILFAIGGLLVYYKRIEVGGILACIQLFNYLVNPILRISDLMNYLKGAKPIYKELTEKAKEKEKVGINLLEDLDSGNLELRNISFKYKEGHEDVVKDFSVNFKDRGKYLIVGRSGSGKSTLAKLMTGEIKPNEGNIFLNGKDLSNYSDSEALKYIQYIDQNSYLFKDTIENNITLYRDVDEGKISSLKNNLSIENLHFEDTISDELGLSGGQKSRINIARSLIKSSPIYIFDEPTAALDHEIATSVMKYLLDIDATIVIISHMNDENIKEMFDEVIDLNTMKNKN